MKRNIILSVLFSVFTTLSFAQKSNSEFITIIFKNHSLLPKKCSIISYAPNENGNGTQSYWLFPNTTKKLKFKEGTKLYLVNQKQVNTVMGGKRIDNEEPFIIVKKQDDNQTFKF